MKTNVPGLIELSCGWVVGIGALPPGLVKVTLQYDPQRELPLHGTKVLNLSEIEAGEIEDALRAARESAGAL